MAITAEIKSGKLIIIADMNGNTKSKSGKSILLASTGGFMGIDDIQYSLNVIRKKKWLSGI